MHFRLLGRTRAAIAFGLATLAYRQIYTDHTSAIGSHPITLIHQKLRLCLPEAEAIVVQVAKVDGFESLNVIADAKVYRPYLGAGIGGWGMSQKMHQ